MEEYSTIPHTHSAKAWASKWNCIYSWIFGTKYKLTLLMLVFHEEKFSGRLKQSDTISSAYLLLDKLQKMERKEKRCLFTEWKRTGHASFCAFRWIFSPFIISKEMFAVKWQPNEFISFLSARILHIMFKTCWQFLKLNWTDYNMWLWWLDLNT